MPLRLGIPLTLLLLGVSLWLGYQWDFRSYWWVVAVATLLCVREAKAIGMRGYASMLALPSVGLAAALVVGFPLVFPWFLRVRHEIITDRLARGAPRVGRGAYAMVGALVVLSGWGTIVAWRWRSSGEPVALLAVANAVASECDVGVNVSRAGDRFVTTVFGPTVTAERAWQRPFARRIARLAWRAHPARESIRASDVIFRTVEQRGDVNVTRDLARYGWWASEFTIDGESGALNAADDSLARAAAPLVYAGDTVALRRLPTAATLREPGAFAPFLRFLREQPGIGPAGEMSPIECRTFHDESGNRWRAYKVRAGSRDTRFDIALGSDSGRGVVAGLHVTVFTAPDTL